jgi:hypothetical protein
MPSCSPHLTPLATGSLERSLLVFSTPGGLTGDDLSRLFFTYTNTSQPQPALAILRQESVHTTLSITHHRRKRPSTGPRTTHGPLKQSKEGTFVHQAKYTKDIVRKFKMENSKAMTTPMSTTTALDADEEGEHVDQKEYRSMIGSVLYLTAMRTDIQF